MLQKLYVAHIICCISYIAYVTHFQSVKIFKQKHEKEKEELKANHRVELAHQQDVFDRTTDAVLEKILKTKNENKKLEAGIHFPNNRISPIFD